MPVRTGPKRAGTKRSAARSAVRPARPAARRTRPQAASDRCRHRPRREVASGAQGSSGLFSAAAASAPSSGSARGAWRLGRAHEARELSVHTQHGRAQPQVGQTEHMGRPVCLRGGFFPARSPASARGTAASPCAQAGVDSAGGPRPAADTARSATPKRHRPAQLPWPSSSSSALGATQSLARASHAGSHVAPAPGISRPRWPETMARTCGTGARRQAQALSRSLHPRSNLSTYGLFSRSVPPARYGITPALPLHSKGTLGFGQVDGLSTERT